MRVIDRAEELFNDHEARLAALESGRPTRATTVAGRKVGVLYLNDPVGASARKPGVVYLND